jgi:multidrug resistance efflux pump
MSDSSPDTKARAGANTPDPSSATSSSTQQWHPPAKNLRTLVMIAALALFAVLAILYAWQLPPFAGLAQRTDDAYVRGRVTIISPQVDGYVVSVPVRDFENVRAGQILATIDDRIYRARVAQAEANVSVATASLANSQQAQRSREAAITGQDAGIANAQAQLVLSQTNMKRADSLIASSAISQQSRDQTRATLLAAEAGVRQAQSNREIGTQDVQTVIVGRDGLRAAVDAAKAQLRLAQIDLDNTVIRAPSDGQLSEIGVRQGAYVTAGTQLMSLVPHDLWVIANYKEAQTADMRIGQAVTFRIDALHAVRLTGQIEDIAPAAGSEFAVLRPDNATGNFVKVAQRIAVRIRIDPNQPAAARLRAGMSVETAVDTNR